jgi:hypothetical protein
MGVNLLDLTKEIGKSTLPLSFMLLRKDISVESLEFLNLFLNFFSFSIDHGSVTCDSFKIWTKDGIEFLDDHASCFEITQNSSHVDRLFENFLLSGEIPSFDSLLLLDISLSGIVFFFPFGKN